MAELLDRDQLKRDVPIGPRTIELNQMPLGKVIDHLGPVLEDDQIRASLEKNGWSNGFNGYNHLLERLNYQYQIDSAGRNGIPTSHQPTINLRQTPVSHEALYKLGINLA